MMSVLTTDTIRLSIEAQDNVGGSGIRKAEFYVNYFLDNGFPTEKHYIGEDDTFPYEFLWDCSHIPDQYFQKLSFFCEVTDNAGNRTTHSENVRNAYDYDLSVVLDRNNQLNTNTITSRYSKKEIVIDGDFGDWAQQDSIVFTNNDNRIVASSLWNDKYVYFSIRVYDRSYISNAVIESKDIVSMFNEDIIEIFFDTNHDHNNIYSSPDKSLKISPAGKIMLTEIWFDKSLHVDLDESIRTGCKQIIDGTLNDDNDEDYCWTMELSIPWEKLECNPYENARMGLEIWNNDKDYVDGTYFFAGWTTTSPVLLNPSEWGDIAFVDGSRRKFYALLIGCMVLVGGASFFIFGRKLLRYKALPTESPVQGIEKETIKKAKQFIKEHYMEESLCRKQVSQHIGLTPSYFSDIFKKEAGMGFTDYITYIRIAHAKILLSTTKKTVSEIAYETGFSSPSYFGYSFKKEEHISPKEFRRKHSTPIKSN